MTNRQVHVVARLRFPLLWPRHLLSGKPASTLAPSPQCRGVGDKLSEPLTSASHPPCHSHTANRELGPIIVTKIDKCFFNNVLFLYRHWQQSS
ncbi:hypothetical protein Pmani_019231 [Petrolisthes manimaculis]|uniref:Uncharacterized protein n=1 Tax=Petrolisthes manimaculis TaxID=1843537 RepID=A0AAE1U5X4_9EUCA|nr:hypothetical protein Pmani_019231 [Petrolisthes manimaculis]